MAHVTIASMNLHCGAGTRGQPFDIEAAIAGLAADVIVLQETWSPEDAGTDPVESAAKAMGARLFRVPQRRVRALTDIAIPLSAGPGAVGIALLTTLPVTGYEVVRLRHIPGDVAARRAQIATVGLPGGRALRVTGTHLTYRLASPVQLAQILLRLGTTSLPTVIAGDLNMPRQVARCAPGYEPAVRGRTWPAELPLVQLDHVLVGRGATLVDAAVLPPAGSDHLPVRARLRIPA